MKEWQHLSLIDCENRGAWCWLTCSHNLLKQVVISLIRVMVIHSCAYEHVYRNNVGKYHSLLSLEYHIENVFFRVEMACSEFVLVSLLISGKLEK